MQFSREEHAEFAASTRMVVGDGASTLFLEDRWLDGRAISDIAPELMLLVSGRIRKRWTVQEALVDRGWISDIRGALSPIALWQYIQVWRLVRSVHLSTFPDVLQWRWTLDCQYTFRSCYGTLFQRATSSSSWRLNWRLWAPHPTGSISSCGWLAKISAGPPSA